MARITKMPNNRSKRVEATPPPSEPPAASIVPFDPNLPRPQATIKRVAELLAYSTRHVRDLCARNELETNGIRGRGLRIFLDSVAAYQRRHRKAS